jgi:hypothetical protein
VNERIHSLTPFLRTTGTRARALIDVFARETRS